MNFVSLSPSVSISIALAVSVFSLLSFAFYILYGIRKRFCVDRVKCVYITGLHSEAVKWCAFCMHFAHTISVYSLARILRFALFLIRTLSCCAIDLLLFISISLVLSLSLSASPLFAASIFTICCTFPFVFSF